METTMSCTVSGLGFRVNSKSSRDPKFYKTELTTCPGAGVSAVRWNGDHLAWSSCV